MKINTFPQKTVQTGSNLVNVIRAIAEKSDGEETLKGLADTINFSQIEHYIDLIEGQGQEHERESDVMSSMLRGLDEKTLICLISDNMFLTRHMNLIDLPLAHIARSGRVDFLREYFNKYYDYVTKPTTNSSSDGFYLQYGKKVTNNGKKVTNSNFMYSAHKLPMLIYDSTFKLLQANFCYEEHFLSNNNLTLAAIIDKNSQAYKEAKFKSVNDYFDECRRMLDVMSNSEKKEDYEDANHYLNFFKCYAKASITGFKDIEENLKNNNLTPGQFLKYCYKGIQSKAEVENEKKQREANDEIDVKNNKGSESESEGRVLIQGLKENICEQMSVESFTELLSFIESMEKAKEITTSEKAELYSYLVDGQFNAWNKSFKNAFMKKSSIHSYSREDFAANLTKDYNDYVASRDKLIILAKNEETQKTVFNKLNYCTSDILYNIFRTTPLNPNYLSDLAQIIEPNFNFEFEVIFDNSKDNVNKIEATGEKECEKMRKLKFNDILNLAYYTDIFTKKPIGYMDAQGIEKHIKDTNSSRDYVTATYKHYHGTVYQYKNVGIELAPTQSVKEIRNSLIQKHNLMLANPDNIFDFFNPKHKLCELIDVLASGFMDLGDEDNKIKLEQLFLTEKLEWTNPAKIDKKTSLKI